MALRIDPSVFSDVLAPAAFNIADAFATATTQQRLAKRREALRAQDQAFALKRDEAGRAYETGRDTSRDQRAIEMERLRQEGAMALLNTQIDAGRYDQKGKAKTDPADEIGIDPKVARAIQQAEEDSVNDLFMAQGVEAPMTDASGKPIYEVDPTGKNVQEKDAAGNPVWVKEPDIRPTWMGGDPGTPKYKQKKGLTGKLPDGSPYPADLRVERDSNTGKVILPNDPRVGPILAALRQKRLTDMGIDPVAYRKWKGGQAPAGGGAAPATTVAPPQMEQPVTPPTMPVAALTAGPATAAPPVAAKYDPKIIAQARQELQQDYPGENFAGMSDDQIVAEHKRRWQAQAAGQDAPQPARSGGSTQAAWPAGTMVNALTIPMMPANPFGR